MAKIHSLVKHRSVIDRKPEQDISQAPEMEQLKDLFADMTENEKARTLEYTAIMATNEGTGTEETQTGTRKIKPYCTQNNGDCETCSLVNYGRDCRNFPVEEPGEL